MPVFSDSYGIAIHYETWRVTQPRAVVQLAHGVGEHIGRYRELIAVLNASGYSVWADDHRGHGQTGLAQHGGDASKLGKLGPGGLRAAVAAVHQFTGVIRETEGTDVPLVFIGHSWGSFIAQLIINDHADEYDGVVLTGTAYRMLHSMNSGNLNRRHRALGTSPVEWLSRDPTVAPRFMADPLATATPLPVLFGLPDSIRLLGRPSRHLARDVPMLIMVGSDDPLGGEPSARKLAESYLRRSGLTDVEVIVYLDARHEVFNEINRDEVFHDLTTWLQTRWP